MRTIVITSALLVFGIVLNAQLLEVEGDVDVAGGQIHSVGDPTNAQDAATKAYVDALENQIILLKNTIIAGGFVQDGAGNNYHTVKIGTQTWMAENLNMGLRIDGAIDQTSTPLFLVQKYCYDDLESNCDIYGGLYQWDEMMRYGTTEGAQGICPIDWHLPTDAEWDILRDYLDPAASGNDNIAGGKMKEVGLVHWNAPNTDATNESGFTGLPGGLRGTGEPTFIIIGRNGNWWSSSVSSIDNAWSRVLEDDKGSVDMFNDDKRMGLSVRCLRD